MTDRRRRVLRFFGPRGDLLAAEMPSVAVFDASGNEKFRVEIQGFLDVAPVPVGDELWVIFADRIERISAIDGRARGTERIDYLDPNGRILQSSTAPQIPIWHAARPSALRSTTPPIPADVILPISEGRWLLWQAGQLRMWRNIGEAWRKPFGEPSTRVADAELVLEGRLFALAQQRLGANGEPTGELRLSIAAVSDGTQHAVLRIPNVDRLAIAARRGIAVARSGDRLNVFDLRFGRQLRELAVPPGTIEFAVDDAFQRIALANANGLDIVAPEALSAALAAADTDDRGDASAKPNGHAVATAVKPVVEPVVEPVVDALAAEPPPSEAIDEPFPDAPLVRLVPVSVTPDATSSEISQSVELELQLVGARAYVAIADAWDVGRIVKPDQTKPPFVDEVAGLLRIVSGRAVNELDRANARLDAMRAIADEARRERGDRLTPLDVLARDFDLSPLSIDLLFVILAPRLRGELARLYGILANDPGRALVDEFLLGQLLGTDMIPEIARELDGDRPLRRFGLVRVGAGDRPFAGLTVDPLVIRYITNQPAEGEPDQYLIVRRVDRDLDELHLPRSLISRALRYLATPRDDEPLRMIVRGRTGVGRHTLLTSLAARAGRSLGVIDLATVPREAGGLANVLEGALRRAMLRGLVPCVDGLEVAGVDDPDMRTQLMGVLRNHPGPIAVRLPTDAQIPLDPGYLLLDVPSRNERERVVTWTAALERHAIDLSDPSELAARYRVGPGTIERVCVEVSRRPDLPTDAAAWVRELDDAVRQHLENRLGKTATRVSRLATWADVVLPEDITDSLLELTARVRHRKKVYEQWGFDKAITTARGITALFQGSPGTGKTMVAGVIARDLGLEVYRVDVSRITSKWIGETEKNLGALFDAAEDGQVMLLFDEADSLFAKRTEVKTSVDRYSNMEVNYLLQRLDSFEGIAVLTTNFGNAIDPAFKRRLTYRVTFPFPDEEMREQLWRALIPAQVPVQGTLDFATLAQRFRLSGGYIRNATLRAAFLAAEEGTSLTHEHLERAIRMEFREIGKLAESGTLE
ncbi:MAG TPA: ATP-binding protein [Kofleriaceae bacterium]|nr:ATP-binding protein [Kofleriaceae bacterium]